MPLVSAGVWFDDLHTTPVVGGAQRPLQATFYYDVPWTIPTLPRWYQELSRPVYPPPPRPHGGSSYNLAEPTLLVVPRSSQWWTECSVPVRVVPPFERWQGFTEMPWHRAATEVLVSDWFQAFSEPVRSPRQPYLGAGFIADPVEPVQLGFGVLSEWFQQLSVPVRLTPPRQAEFVDPAEPDRLLIPPEWMQPASEPVRPPPRVREGQGVWPDDPVLFGLGQLAEWFTAMSEPVRPARQLGQWGLTFWAGPPNDGQVPTQGDWYLNLATDVVRTPGRPPGVAGGLYVAEPSAAASGGTVTGPYTVVACDLYVAGAEIGDVVPEC